VSDTYHDQLRSSTEGGSFRAGQRCEDAFTWLGYLALQTFLVDACVLRDYLAEFYAMDACPDRALAATNLVTRMSGLIYAYISLDHLTRRARLLSCTSPVEPQAPLTSPTLT